jgi:hypothetical protein
VPRRPVFLYDFISFDERGELMAPSHSVTGKLWWLAIQASPLLITVAYLSSWRNCSEVAALFLPSHSASQLQYAADALLYRLVVGPV